MIKPVTRLIMVAAAANMTVMPVAAQANTRASDSAAVYTRPASQLESGREEDKKKARRGFVIILSFLAAAAIGIGVYLAQDSKEADQSPGT